MPGFTPRRSEGERRLVAFYSVDEFGFSTKLGNPGIAVANTSPNPEREGVSSIARPTYTRL